MIDAQAPTSRPSHRTIAGIAATISLASGLVLFVQSYINARATGREWDAWGSFLIVTPWWISWLLLMPLLALLAARFPLWGARRWFALGAHVALGTLVSSVQLLLEGVAFWYTTGHAQGIAPTLGNQLQRFYGGFFHESILTYIVGVGAFMAMDFAYAVRDDRLLRAQLEARTSALEAAATRARLAALAMELNPHFLFNTLSTINGLIAQEQPAEARDAVRRLGDLLRHTLDAGARPFATVAQEVAFLEDYLGIQQVRFGDRLAVTFDVDTEATNCKMPALLLQPLVENAIRHGIESATGQGTVRIRIAHEDARLRFVVTDSGPGPGVANPGPPAREGVGIANTRSRLDHLYGSDATFELRNAPAGGGEATVTIPLNGSGAAEHATHA